MEQFIRSEWQLVVHLITCGTAQLTEYEIYKACVPEALNGVLRPEAQNLSETYITLLNVRRAIFDLDYKKALKELRLILRQNQDLIIQGDSYYLYGIIFHRVGHFKWAREFLDHAEVYYLQTLDQHKYLRCVINRHLCIGDLKSYLNGELYFLKQQCTRQHYFDLVGNIEKSQACELISKGQFEGALVAAQSAQENYNKAGCAEDGNVAQVLLAICYYCQGQKIEAAKIRSRLDKSKGKYQSFLKVYDQLALGQKPKLEKSHPLYGTPWPILQLRKSSILGQVFWRLKVGPVSREELIATVWGAQALDPSYVNRLHTVIATLRSQYHINIAFDGEYYSLNSTSSLTNSQWKSS